MIQFFTILLRDVWFRILIWVIGIAGLTLAIPPAFANLYSDSSEREALRATLDNPALVAMVGPVPEGAYTVAVMFAHEMLIFMAVVHGLFSIMTANALSRKMEDQGLLEYVNSLGVTRHAIFSSQMLIGILMNVTLGAVIFSGLTLMNIESFTIDGNILYALGTTLFGILFYVITLVLAQLLPASEWSFGVSLALLLLFYLYRSMTDVVDTAYSVASPYHWLTRMAPYAGDHYAWLMPFAVIPVFIWLAWVLFAKRDLGDSCFTFDFKRRTRRIGSYPRLAVSGMKILAISWLAGMLLIGLSYGSIFGDLDSFIGENEFLAQSMEGPDPILQFVGVLILLTAVIGAAPLLMISGRILREERTERLELLVSADISRGRILMFHGVYALLIGCLGIVLSVLGMYGAGAAVDGIDISIWDYMLTAVNYTAALVLFAGLSMLLTGLSGRLHTLVWVYLLYCFFVNYLGVIIGLDDAWRRVTPFYYLAEMPAEAIDWLPWAAVTGIGVVLGIIGVILFERRDIG